MLEIHLSQEILGDILAMVGVDQSQGVQASSLGVARAGARRVLVITGLQQTQQI